MRRAGHLFEQVVGFFPLVAAARRAARGKRLSRATAAFLLDLEPEVLQLQRELLGGSYRPQPYTTFEIRDPKPRTISAAAFRDGVVHHSLCAALEPVFERYANEELAWEVAATTEPTCVAYNGVFERAGGFRPGAYVVVYGAGPIGLGAIQLSKAAGAAKVIAFEISEVRRKLAKKVGADYVYDPSDVTASEVVMDLTQGAGADLSVEAAGAPDKTIPEMEKTLAINGKIAQIGRAALRVPMYLESFQIRRGQLFGAQGHSGHGIFPSVIRMMGSGLIDNSKIITSRFPLDQALDALEQATKRQDGKIIIKP